MLFYSRDREQFEEEEEEEGLVGRKWFPLKDTAWALNQHLSHTGKKRKSESSVTLPSAKKHVPESIW